MSGLPQTRTIDQSRRVNIPAEIAAEYPAGQQFVVERDGDDLVLEPGEGADARTLTEKNRVRVRPGVAEQIQLGSEYAVVKDGQTIILRPVEDIDITL